MEETSERTLPEAPPASTDPSATAGSPSADAASRSSEVEGVAVSREPSESASAEAAQGEARVEGGEPAEGAAADAADGEEDAEGEGEAAADGSAPGKTPGKRKRRRRRKRKDGSTSAGEVVAAEAGAEGAPKPEPAKKKEPSHAPFAHRFSGAAGGKRHAFAVGEVVAGRVQRVEHGVIVVDLFGKATAVADEYEPREIPPLPEPPVGSEAGSEASSEGPEEGAVTAAGTIDAAESAESAVGHDIAGEPNEVAAEASASARAALDEHDVAAEASPEPASVEQAPVVDAGSSDVSSMVAAAQTELANIEPQPSDHAQNGSAGYVATAPEEHAQEATEPGGLAALSAAGSESDDDAEEEPESAAAPEPPREKPEPPAIGQVFKGRVGAVSESGHIALLNRIIDGKAVRAKLAQAREQHQRVHGVVYGFNRGGFDVLVEGLRAFCPASAMSLEDIHDPLEYVGHKLEFLLPTSKAGSKDIIVSRRSILERLQRRKTKEFLRSLTPGLRFKGKVTAVRDFGLFVDIGGVEGLVHQSELSYAFGVKPASVAKVGDEIDVQVLRVGGEPRREKDSGKKDRLTRVSLSVKALLPDPWDAHAQALTEGAVHKGKVVRATEFGAFIELVPEIEGLLHITELGRDLKHASQAVQEGDDIYVAVERIDRRARRISLSKLSPAEIQEFEAGGLVRDESSTRNLRQGNNVKLKIERIEPRCVFARVSGTVGKRGRAFIPSSETGTDRGTDLRKRFPIGSELEAKIIGIDRDGSLKCSVKAMQIDEERQAVKNYRREAAKQGFGTFGDLLRAKLGEAQK
jgi:small subunit ribosomal protein S1